MEKVIRPLDHDKTREATSSIRGYVYQAYQSILAWMRLKEDDLLFLEAAEDFDVHEPELVTVTQVKDTAGSGSITLRSEDVIDAINNYWRHKNSNAERLILFRFLSTSEPGQEKGIKFGDVGKGIEYWKLAGRNDHYEVEPLKDFLLTLSLDESLKDFLRDSDDTAIRSQILSKIQWDTGKNLIDGLIVSIEERLISHGDKKGVDSFSSKKALAYLLQKVTDLLAFAGDRRLNYADFCQAFDEATMEVMPKGEALVLRSMLNRLSPLANASSVATTNQPLQVLEEPLPLVRGATSRDDVVTNYESILRNHGAIILRGSTGLGKTSLARLVTDRICGEWAWAGFRGRTPTHIADLFKRAAVEIRNLGITPQVVLDDLDFGGLAKFEKELLALAFSVLNAGGHVILTGPSMCPPDFLNKLWLPTECDQVVTYLNEKDIADIACFHGLTDRHKLHQWSRAILITTQGHPQLVHARIKNLESKGWPPLEEMTWLYDKSDLVPEREATRRRLSDEIPSDGARLLAYRLSLISEKFTRTTALKLAELPPPIALPGESFDLIVGPWIEKIGPDTYRVSPILADQGKDVLALAEANAVHEAIALELLSRKTLSPSDVGAILTHALISRSEKALIFLTQGIMTADREIWQSLGDAVFWFPSMALEPGQHIFQENLFIDFMLRLSQFRIAATSKQADKSLAIMDRAFEVLAKQDKQVSVPNAAMAYLVFLTSIEIPIPPRRSVDMISRLIDISKVEHDFGDIFSNLLSKDNNDVCMAGLTPAQSLFSFEAARISGLADLKELLEALNELEQEKRDFLLEVFETEEVTDAELLVGTAWWKDASQDRLNVEEAYSILLYAIELAKKWGANKLLRAAYVAMSVIYDEYGDSPENALSILDQAEERIGSNDARILNQRAKVLLHQKNNAEALELFDQALVAGALPTTEQMFASRNGGIAAARIGDWASAERFFLGGSQIPTLTEDMVRMAIGLLADAAFARWKQGKTVDSLMLYSDVLKKMETIPIDDNLKNRYLHAIVKHSLLWIDLGEKATQNNIVEPMPGACSNQEPHEGYKDLDIKDMSASWGMLGSIDTKFGTGLELAKLAKERCHGKLPLLMDIMQRISRLQALYKNLEVSSAVQIFVEMYESLQCHAPMEAEQMDGWVPSEIQQLPSDYWDSKDRRENLLNRILSVAITSACIDLSASLPIDDWRQDLDACQIKGHEINIFFDIISGKSTPKTDELLQVVAGWLYRLQYDDLSPKDLFVAHFRMLNFLSGQEWGQYSGDIFANRLSRHWQHVAQTQKFALISPSLYAPILLERCNDKDLSGYSKTASILEVAASATGVSLAKSSTDFLHQIRDGSPK